MYSERTIFFNYWNFLNTSDIWNSKIELVFETIHIIKWTFLLLNCDNEWDILIHD